MYKPTDKKRIKKQIIKGIEKGLSIIQLTAGKETPDANTINNWLNKDTDFLKEYARAKENHFILESYKMLEIIDSCGLTKEEIMKARAQVDVRQWFLGRLKPKRFGSNTAQTNIQINNVQPVTGMQILDSTEEMPPLEE